MLLLSLKIYPVFFLDTLSESSEHDGYYFCLLVYFTLFMQIAIMHARQLKKEKGKMKEYQNINQRYLIPIITTAISISHSE